jgi:putative membrane protein
VTRIVLAHGDVVPVSELGSAWEPAPAIVAAAALALALFAQAFIRLRRRGRGDHAGYGRAVLFTLGVALITLALVSPLDAVGEEYLLSAHMLEHVLIGDLGIALIVVALRGPLLFFFLPAAVLGPLARARPIRGLFAFLVRPGVSLAIWMVTIAAWHVPAAYEATLDSRAVHDLEHATFVLAGFLVWYQMIDPARRGVLRRSARLGFAVALFAAAQILSMVLIFSLDPLYATYAAQDERLLGLSPLTDQRLAGVVMMAEQALTLGTFAAVMLFGELGRARESARLGVQPRP